MDTASTPVCFWVSPLGIAIVSLLGLLILGLLGWWGRRMFNWWRSRITVKNKPIVEVSLIRDTVGRTKPMPILRINLRGMDIFTRQADGYYWFTADFVIPGREPFKLTIEREPYKRFMALELGRLDYFEIPLQDNLSDWSLWQNNGELLKEATLTSRLYINDRWCQLTRLQKPSTIRLYEQ